MANKAIVGEKVGMTQVWDEDNQVIPVTVLRVRPNRVVQVKTQERDGYSALQITFGEKDIEKMKQPEAGHIANSGVVPGSRLVELRIDDVADYQVGQEITVDEMAEIGRVDVTSVSKGKGFAGAMKRHGFGGLPASHGAHKVHRKPGAVGQCATPSRIFRGKRMPGRMGNQKTTILNLSVVQADAEREILLVRGAVPGPNGSVVLIRDAVKGA